MYFFENLAKVWAPFLYASQQIQSNQEPLYKSNLKRRVGFLLFCLLSLWVTTVAPSHPLSPFSTVTSIISMCFFITSTNVFWSLPLRISPNSFIQQIHSLGTFSNHLNLYSLKANFSTIWRPSDLLIIITPGEILSIILLSLLSYNSSFSTLLLLYFNKTFLTPHFHPFHPACILFSNSFCALSISLQGWPSVQMFPKLNTDYGSQSSTCWSP